MTNASPLRQTHTSTVTPDQIDELGHMNVRWYGHNALAGTRAFVAQLGMEDPALVSTYTRHHNEQLVESELALHSAILAADEAGPGLRIYHELSNRDSGELAATFVHDVDVQPGQSDAIAELPSITLPEHGRPRSLRLDTDALTNAPTLEEVQQRDLAMRLARDVTTDDSMGADHVPAWLANNLIWAGERPGGEEDWIRTGPNGERIAFATMESRLWIGRLAPVGARIQSFGAVVETGDKTSHSLSWAFDLNTGDVLAVFEVLNLCFNLGTRRSMVMPDAIRHREHQRLHPDLATPVPA